MKFFTLVLATATLVIAAGCSTKHLEPEIGAFGSSVDVALKSAEAEIKRMNLDQRLRDDRIEALVQSNGFFQLDCGGGYVNVLEVNAEAPAQISLAEKCPLATFDKEANAFNYVPTDASLGHAAQARRLIDPLRGYAGALEDLSKSKAPEDVSKNFAAASKSLRDLAVGVSKVDNGPGIARDTQKIIETGSGLAASLVREGLEAMRYAALKKIVTNGDEAVHGAGVILAAWMQSREDEALSADMQRVRGAEEMAIVTRFDGDRVAMRQAYDEVVLAYDAALKADEKAKWRAFIGMAIAHRALKEAFEKPADLSRMQEAHDRLEDFVDQALKLKAALDAAE